MVPKHTTNLSYPIFTKIFLSFFKSKQIKSQEKCWIMVTKRINLSYPILTKIFLTLWSSQNKLKAKTKIMSHGPKTH